MPLRVGRALRNGAAQLVTPVGAGLYLAFALLFTAFQATVYGLAATLFAERSGSLVLTPVFSPLGYAASLPVYALALAGTGLGLVSLTVVLTRAFARGCQHGLPPAVVRRRVGWAVFHFLVGGLTVALTVAAGTLLLVVPGVLAYLGLLFTQFYIAVEDAPFPRAMRRSWRATADQRLQVLLLVVSFGAFSVLNALVAVFLTRELFGLVPFVYLEVLEVFLNTVVFVFAMATMADAYRQLRARKYVTE